MVQLQKQAICDRAIIKIANGNPDALCDIYKQLGRQIFTLAISILHNYQSAEDIMQDTFLQISGKAHTYRKGSNATAWILSITRNLALDEYRHRKYEVSDDELEEAETTDEIPFEELEALSVLDDEEKQIVLLKIYSKLKHKQIAEILGITTYATEKKYQRAVVKLRAYYNEEENYKWELKEN